MCSADAAVALLASKVLIFKSRGELSLLVQPGVIEIRDKRYKLLMHCHQYFFGGKYDLIQLHRKNDGTSMRNSLEPSPPAFSI